MQDSQNHAENFLREIKPLPESNPIIAAIAAYLDDKTTARVNQFEEFNLEFVEPINGNYNDYLIKLSTEISAAIAPLVEAVDPDWNDAPQWAQYWTLDYLGNQDWFELAPKCEYVKAVKRPA